VLKQRTVQHRHGRKYPEIKKTRSSDTSASIYQTTRRHA